MGTPVTVTIPHHLGKAEAERRLKAGFAQVRNTFGSSFAVVSDTWSGDHLDFRAELLGQKADGTVDVADDHVVLKVELPWMLAMLAGKARTLIQKQGQLMLDKPAPAKPGGHDA